MQRRPPNGHDKVCGAVVGEAPDYEESSYKDTGAPGEEGKNPGPEEDSG